MATDLIDITTYLEQFRDEPVLYRANLGNGGDAVVASATLQLFDRCGLQVEMWSEDSNPDGRIVMYGGGGNLTPSYHDAADFIEANHSRAKKFVLLPHTIDGNDDLLRSLGSNVDLICREPLSYAHVQKVRGEQDLYLADDLALSLDVRAILNGGFPDLQGHAKERKYLRRYARLKRNLFILRRYSELRSLLSHRGLKEVRCFRGDVEKTLEPIPPLNFDLSRRVPSDRAMTDPRTIQMATFSILSFLQHFDILRTNHLNLAISALLLGKQVRLYRNSYWKNRAIFYSSLANRFEYVIWVS